MTSCKADKVAVAMVSNSNARSSRDESIFFFQAEDGIRDYKVTGVQTCALPIYGLLGAALEGAVQRGDGQQARVVAGERSVVRERDLLGAASRELQGEAAELGSQQIGRASCRERV